MDEKLNCRLALYAPELFKLLKEEHRAYISEIYSGEMDFKHYQHYSSCEVCSLIDTIEEK